MEKQHVELKHPVTIRIFSDFVCPWCYVGDARFRAALSSVRFSKAVTVEHAPYLLRPDNPEDGIDVMANLREKYGPEQARVIVERVEAAAHGEGLRIDYQKMGKNYPTVRAHALLAQAQGMHTQDDLKRALMRAHFVEGRNIYDVPTLVEIGQEHGFEAARVREIVTDKDQLAAIERQARNASRFIQGVPYFVMNQRVSISGAQPAHILLQAIVRAGQLEPPLS